MAFSELNYHRLVLRGLDRLGLAEPTAIQAQAAPAALEGRDLIGLAPTGTGKTIAYLAPVLHHLLEHRPPRSPSTARLRALVLVPTRELARQVMETAEALAKGTVLRVGCIHGGVSPNPQAAVIERGVDLVLATPGRVIELLTDGRISFAFLRHLVIDEADKLFDMGFLPQVDDIAARMSRDVQRMLFSATMPPAVAELADLRLRKPARIEIGTHTRPADHVKQHLMPCHEHLKTRLLLRLLEDSTRTGVLLFVRTKRRAGWVAGALARHGIDPGVLHGDRSQAQRLRALDQFAKGEKRLIVATDVAARGLHVPAVRTVVNYDLPAQPEEFVHRIGRAGHGGGFGEALTLLDPRDGNEWRDIARIVGLEALRGERLDDFDYAEPPRRKATGAVSRPVAARGGTRGTEGTRAKKEVAPVEPAKPARKKHRKRDDEAMVKRGRLKSRGGGKQPISKKDKPGGGVKRMRPHDGSDA